MSGHLGVGPVYPVMLRLVGRRALVVGGSAVAAAKAAGLLDAGATVTLVDPDPGPEVGALGDRVDVQVRGYRAGEVADYFLAITASDAETNAAVFADGEANQSWVNAADDPDHCNVVLPAVLRREPVVVAVSTAGSSPALAQWLRNRIGTLVGPCHGELSTLLGEARQRISAAGLSNENLPWATLIDTVEPLLAAGDGPPARRAIDAWVDTVIASNPPAVT